MYSLYAISQRFGPNFSSGHFLDTVARLVIIQCCVGMVSSDLLSQEEKDTLLSLHNAARRTLSVSTLTGVALPGAVQMQELVWDYELEVIAQQTANICVYEHADPDTEEFALFEVKYGTPGQNLAGGTNVTSAFIHWYDFEARWWDPETYECQDGKDCGHFHQILMDGLEKIGCGRPDPYYCDKSYLFCDFLPGLDTTSDNPYTEGDDPCSDMDSSYTVDGWLCLICTDEEPIECAKMKSENGGECSDDFQSMCNFTCGMCDGGEQYLPYLCQDEDGIDCDEYDDAGYCDSDSEFYWMAMRDCRDTCGMKCDCMDSKSRCSRYSSSYCDVDSDYHLFMVLYCPDTCGFCEMELNITYWSPTLAVNTTQGGVTTPSTTPLAPATTSLPPGPPISGCESITALQSWAVLQRLVAAFLTVLILNGV